MCNIRRSDAQEAFFAQRQQGTPTQAQRRALRAQAVAIMADRSASAPVRATGGPNTYEARG